MTRLVFQIFTGDLTEQSLADPDLIISKLTMAQEAGRLGGVLCGWSRDRAFYEKLGEKLHAWGVPLYLKIAAFSELKGYRNFDPMIDYHGDPMEPYVLNPQESFEFRCPSSNRNRSALLELFQESFAQLPLDGVFLDRIRYPSFLSGIAGIGGCFCPDCVKRYQEAGIDVDQLRSKLSNLAMHRNLQLKSYEKGCWQLKNPVLDAFFNVKGQVIQEALAGYVTYFHSQNLKVGFDLFAPALGYFCGQNVQKLRQLADFIKPMMYRYTDAPAGLPFELGRLEQAAGLSAAEQFKRQAGGSRAHEEELVKRELFWLREEPGCPVWPGVEANYIEPIALITPQQIRDNIQLLESLGYTQMVASWNLARIPEENMKALLES